MGQMLLVYGKVRKVKHHHHFPPTHHHHHHHHHRPRRTLGITVVGVLPPRPPAPVAREAPEAAAVAPAVAVPFTPEGEREEGWRKGDEGGVTRCRSNWVKVCVCVGGGGEGKRGF